MLKINKYRNLILAIILTSLVAIIQGADEPAIDINEITKSNPFTQFTANQNQAPIAATPMIAVKPDLFVETATLKFLDAKSVKTSIAGMSSEYGSIEPDSKGNTLIICDTNENLEKIIKQIRKIDRKPDQIMIEVVLVDVKLNDETEIGINWDMLTTRDHDAVFRQNFGNRLGSTERSSGDGTSGTTNTVGNATAFNTTGIGSALWLVWPRDIRTVINALQEKNNVEVLGSPRVMVVSGKNAIIKSVEERPYTVLTETSNGGSMTNTEFKEIGVTLDVTATLTDEKFILLDVKTQYDVAASTGSPPAVDKRGIQSSLLLEDSQVLVIGGLRRKETQKQTKQLPILGDIPIVGLAFKSTDTVENNSELLIILSPHIYKGENPNDLEMQKFNEITQRPLLTIPETDERREKEKKQEAEKMKKTEKAKKANKK